MSVTRTRTAGRALALALLACVLPAPVPAAAQPAAPADAAARQGHLDGLEFSRDGTDWSPTPPPVLFADGFVDAPGESRSASVLVRNGRSVPVRLATALTGLAWSEPEAGTAFRLSSSDQWGGGIVDAPIQSIARCEPLTPTRILAAGDVLAISVTVRLDDTARGTPAETASVGFELLIALAEYPGRAPVSACSDLAQPATAPVTPGGSGIVAIASLPTEMLPGTAPDPRSAGALVAPALAVALGAGIVGLAVLVTVRLRRGLDDDDEEDAA